MEDPKETENCNVFKLYALLASNEQIIEMKLITIEVTTDMVMQNRLCMNCRRNKYAMERNLMN